MTMLKQNDSIRKELWIPVQLSQKIDEIKERLGLNFTEVTKIALTEFINMTEKERLEKEMIEACKFYFAMDKEMASDWKEAETEVE
jgi:hypothetical protein